MARDIDGKTIACRNVLLEGLLLIFINDLN